MGNWPFPLAAMFLRDQFVLAIFVESHPVNMSNTLILNSDHQFQSKIFFNFCLSAISHAPWQSFFMDQFSISYFYRGSTGDHFCQINFRRFLKFALSQ